MLLQSKYQLFRDSELIDVVDDFLNRKANFVTSSTQVTLFKLALTATAENMIFFDRRIMKPF